ncbi:MAG: periplasmic heavy metal sensor [Spirochaetes bacterium]|nr:periplasmic heavy metal sensor [Spirochaetota bacterium]MBX3720820.1 periplasmic heavy metal sensor [Turneriella sp.]
MKSAVVPWFAFALALVSVAAAERPHGAEEGPGHQRRGDPKKHFAHLVKELKLSKDQQDKAKALREMRDSLIQAQREKMRPLHEELRQLLEAEKVDLVAVRQQLETIGKAQIEMRMQDIQGRLEFEALLTPEQKKKLRAMHKKKPEPPREGKPPVDDHDTK